MFFRVAGAGFVDSLNLDAFFGTSMLAGFSFSTKSPTPSLKSQMRHP